MTLPCKQCENPRLKGIHTCGIDGFKVPMARIEQLEAANAKLELTLKGAIQRGGELLGENAKLREALRFYAEPGNYSKKLTYLGTKPCVGPSVVERDWGETARKALEE